MAVTEAVDNNSNYCMENKPQNFSQFQNLVQHRVSLVDSKFYFYLNFNCLWNLSIIPTFNINVYVVTCDVLPDYSFN